MRILRIFHGGGVPGYQLRDEELANLGWDVTLMVPKRFRELPSVTVAAPREDVIRVVPVDLFGIRRNPFFFYSPFRVARVIRKYAPQVIDIHEEPYSLAVASVLIGRRIARSRVPFIFRSSQNVYKRYPAPFRQIQSWVLRNASAAYVPSEQAREVLLRKGFNGPSTVIGNGVEIGKARSRGTSVAGDRLKVIFVGRLTERKGIAELVEAVRAIGRSVHLTVVGDGPLGDQLFANLAPDELDLIEFIGAVPHDRVKDYFACADVVCVPSHILPGWSEQFSRALVEGMANYCVPLVSRSGALPAVSGNLIPPVEPGDSESLEVGLRQLLLHTDLERLKADARSFVESEYSWRATSAKLSGMIKGIVGEK